MSARVASSACTATPLNLVANTSPTLSLTTTVLFVFVRLAVLNTPSARSWLALSAMPLKLTAYSSFQRNDVEPTSNTLSNAGMGPVAVRVSGVTCVPTEFVTLKFNFLPFCVDKSSGSSLVTRSTTSLSSPIITPSSSPIVT